MLYFKLDHILGRLKAFFEEVPNIQEVYLFGSVAREDHLPWSDIDLLILTEDPAYVRPIVTEFLNEIYVNEAILINAIFDDFKNISMVTKQFKKEGKLLWVKSKNLSKN